MKSSLWGLMWGLIAIISFFSCSTEEYDIILSPPEVGERAIEYARKYIKLDAEYEWGGQDPLPKIVVDCSGLVIRCYEYACEDYGYFMLFRDTNSVGLKRYTQEVYLEELRAGDLIFMGDGSISHVALFVERTQDKIVFIDSTYKPSEGINGVSERSYPISDSRFLSFGRLWIGKP